MAPGFPYKLLVRVPLVTLTPLAMLLLFHRIGGFPLLSISDWGSHALLAAQLVFVAGVIAQLYAVPAGMCAVYRAGEEHSFKHNLALLCGALQLALAFWMAVQVSSVV